MARSEAEQISEAQALTQALVAMTSAMEQLARVQTFRRLTEEELVAMEIGTGLLCQAARAEMDRRLGLPPAGNA